MNGLPIDIDLSPLLESEVVQICFGEYEVIFKFGNGCSVTVEDEWIYSNEGTGVSVKSQSFLEKGGVFLGVIGKKVSSAARTEDGGICLQFTKGEFFRVNIVSKDYESMQVTVGGRLYVA